MHWSEQIANKIIERNPNKEEYVCAAGISPSGSIHIGNFRDIATSYFVCIALRKLGKKARLLFSWDEFDRLRKIPVNVKELKPEDESYMDDCIGKPYVDVADPYGTASSWGEHFEIEFEASLKKFGIEVDFRHQAKEYRSGRYTKQIIHSLEKRGEIFDILGSFRTQDVTAEERAAYYPVSIYCDKCNKDNTKINSISDDCTEAKYTCSCGHSGDFNFNTNKNCKLAWKIDWPMRWMEEGVDFEPGGKDHASPTGSYQTSKIISEKIFGYKAPLFQGYEFIGIKGQTGKMSGSTGLNLTPDTLLKLYQPEVILWLYSKTEPTKAFNFCFDDEILRQYFEFDKMHATWKDGTDDDYINSIMHNTIVNGRELDNVPMASLVNFGSIVDFNVPMLETIFEKMETPYKYSQFSERLELAKFWLEQCSPESMNRVLERRNWKYFDTQTAEEKQMISLLAAYLGKREYDLDSLNAELYAIPVQVYGEMETKTKKAVQSKFFKDVYNCIIGKDRGPRLYLFLYALELDRYLTLLDFSGEREAEVEEVVEVVEDHADAGNGKAVLEDEPVRDIKEEIEIDDFAKIDMRVCKVINCEAVKKSRSFLKLTLFDGIGERTIMSSIKEEYTPEQIIGKKIIVVANLKPTKFSGVVSEGMLLAGTANSCGCKLIFVDDSVPEGTAIS